MIDVIDLCKNYRLGDLDVEALKNVSFSVEAGENIAIMGASGSGKSTLMNLLGCLDLPSSGVYRLENTNIQSLNANELADVRNRRIGFVFQNFNLLPRVSAIENIELPLLYGRVANSKEKARSALSRVGLAKRGKHKPNQLSGGERQRVAIARALVNEPAIILADEPTGNLDSSTSDEIMNIFTTLHEEGVTVLLVTHEQSIADYAERTLLMKDGQLIEDKVHKC